MRGEHGGHGGQCFPLFCPVAFDIIVLVALLATSLSAARLGGLSTDREPSDLFLPLPDPDLLLVDPTGLKDLIDPVAVEVRLSVASEKPECVDLEDVVEGFGFILISWGYYRSRGVEGDGWVWELWVDDSTGGFVCCVIAVFYAVRRRVAYRVVAAARALDGSALCLCFCLFR